MVNESTNQIILQNFESLTPSLDLAFKDFFTAALSSGLDISEIDNKLLPPLESRGFEYIKVHSDFDTTRKYLKNLRVLWVLLAQNGRLEDARWYLERVLQPIKLFEQRNGILIHKGPIYYFWGGTSLLLGQIDEGFLLMHTAYEEEQRIKEPQPTPSFKFVSLNFSDKNHRFYPLVDMYASYLQQFIVPYRLIKISHFQLDDFRKGFLELNPNPDIVFSFSHTLARLHQLSRFPNCALRSDFSGQYELNLLFDLVLIIENALRIKHPNCGTDKLLFPQLAEFLSSSLSWNLKSGHITGLIQPEADKNYDQCLLDLLNKRFQFSHTISNLDLECGLGIAYLIRNRGAHNVTSSKVIVSRFAEILQHLFNTLFLTAEEKYL